MSWDKIRPILAIALCLIIWGAYFKWFAPKGSPPKRPVPSAAQPEKPKNGSGGTNGGAEKPPDPGGTFKHPDVTPATFVLENDDLHAEFQTYGASLRRLVLRKYRDPHDLKAPLAFLDEFIPGYDSLSLRDPSGAAGWERVQWEPAGATDREVAFRYTQPDGLRLVKSFTLGPEAHAIRMKLTVENLADLPLARSMEIVGPAGILQEATGGVYPSAAHGLWKEGRTYSIEDDDQTLKEIVDKPWEAAGDTISWIAVRNKFFACALLPLDRAAAGKYRAFPVLWEAEYARRVAKAKAAPGSKEAHDLRDWTAHTLGCSVVTAERTWKPGETTTTEWLLYAGPLLDQSLGEGAFADSRLGDILDFGWFSWISRLLLWILDLFHLVFRNYGIAIICLVLVVRMAIYPISKKGQVSMFRMQKLQPQIKALQDRFKGDPQKLNAETFKMMREHGVNPFGGCLPLFLQIPVFLGLYNALLYAIELRQQPFMLWINDLSQPDHLFNLPFTVPFHGTNAFSLLPLIMIVTWFTQAYLQPKSPDPQMAAQQKMFMIMPLVIGYMMYVTPSGLVLYWLISTAWGIAEQQFIKKVYLK
ncbi:MAG: membrane protein insertase YidC [Planctomycetes bacterium]|nr:membrane protein insertase YidC [Planctomycetota bacterium]